MFRARKGGAGLLGAVPVLRRDLPVLFYLSVANFGEFHPRGFWASFELLCHPWFWWPQLCVSPAVPTLARIGRLTCSPFQRQIFSGNLGAYCAPTDAGRLS